MSNPDCTTKTCSKCGNTYPATTEYWHKNGDGLRSQCKTCVREYIKHYYEENPEYRKRYYEENRDKALEYHKHYYEENRDKIQEYGRRYYEENREYYERYREENRDKERERSNRYREENPKHYKHYYEENRDKIQAYRKRWREENPEKMRVNGRNRRARLRNAEGTHTAADIQEHVKGQTDSKGRLRCWWCGKVIKGAYHVDHVIPLAKGGGNGTSNLCISCPVCNLSKNDKLPGEWSGRLM